MKNDLNTGPAPDAPDFEEIERELEGALGDGTDDGDIGPLDNDSDDDDGLIGGDDC